MDEIHQLRKKIDEVDDQILLALCERVKVCEAIGIAKKKRGLVVRDELRENEVYRRIREESVKFKLDPVQIERVYREIVNICSAVQE
jgi:chorismate mutase